MFCCCMYFFLGAFFQTDKFSDSMILIATGWSPPASEVSSEVVFSKIFYFERDPWGNDERFFLIGLKPHTSYINMVPTEVFLVGVSQNLSPPGPTKCTNQIRPTCTYVVGTLPSNVPYNAEGEVGENGIIGSNDVNLYPACNCLDAFQKEITSSNPSDSGATLVSNISVLKKTPYERSSITHPHCHSTWIVQPKVT